MKTASLSICMLVSFYATTSAFAVDVLGPRLTIDPGGDDLGVSSYTSSYSMHPSEDVSNVAMGNPTQSIFDNRDEHGRLKYSETEIASLMPQDGNGWMIAAFGAVFMAGVGITCGGMFFSARSAMNRW